MHPRQGTGRDKPIAVTIDRHVGGLVFADKHGTQHSAIDMEHRGFRFPTGDKGGKTRYQRVAALEAKTKERFDFERRRLNIIGRRMGDGTLSPEKAMAHAKKTSRRIARLDRQQSRLKTIRTRILNEDGWNR